MNLLKKIVQAFLRQFDYQIRRVERFVPSGGAFDSRTPLPADAVNELRPDHPRLLELDRRYQAFDSPVCQHTHWKPALRNKLNDARYFRGDNAYLWAYRALGDMRQKFYIFGKYVHALDSRGLMGKSLTEDGAFGCFSYHYEAMPTISRDLLDSVNELYFLDRHCELLSRKGLRVLDIGAGYGRLAHRMLAATEGVERYWCIDAIPRSTFLSEYYLRYRGYTGSSDSRAVVVPLDEMDAAVAVGSIDLAINIHSFSEMCYEAIEAWIQWLVKLQVPRLFLIPNQSQLLSTESDGSHRDFGFTLERAGFRQIAHEPTLRDPDVREFVGVYDYFWLFERTI